MKITIEEIGRELEEEIIIRCHEVNEDVLALIQAAKSPKDTLVGYDGGNIHRIPLKEVYYMESVDNKTFLYGKDKVYESRQKLYELEAQFCGTSFFRASKATIVNSNQIVYISPSISGRFDATLSNGETVVISRQYVPMLKKHLDI